MIGSVSIDTLINRVKGMVEMAEPPQARLCRLYHRKVGETTLQRHLRPPCSERRVPVRRQGEAPAADHHLVQFGRLQRCDI